MDRKFIPSTPLDRVFLGNGNGQTITNHEVPRYPEYDLVTSPSEINPRSFAKSVETWNSSRIRILMKLASSCLNNIDPNTYALVLTGSDARREKGPYSPFELLVIASDKGVAEYIRSTIFTNLCKRNRRNLWNEIDPDIEIKIIGKQRKHDEYISGYLGDKLHPWPDRVLAGQILAGNPDFLQEARLSTVDEFIHSSSIRRRIRRRLSGLIRIVETGGLRNEQTPRLHFDEEILYFNPDQYVLGFKHNIMRLIQVITTLRQLESEDSITSRLAVDTNTINRLSELFGSVAPSLLEATADAYALALWSYHVQQWRYQKYEQSSEAASLYLGKNLIKIVTSTVLFFANEVRSTEF